MFNACVSSQSEWGRIADDGTVFVKTTDGEREIGSWQAGDSAAGMQFYVRRYEDLATEVDRRGEGPLRLQHVRGRHASRCQRCLERTFDGALHGNFARERLTRSKARRLVDIAEQSLLCCARLRRAYIVCRKALRIQSASRPYDEPSHKGCP